MKQAIVVVAFGTTVRAARKACINPIVQRIKETYSDYDVYLAFSSRIVVKRLRDAGEEAITEAGMMERLIEEGYTSLFVQPLHFTGGAEYDKLKRSILAYEGQGQLRTVRVGRPLLFFMGQEEHPDDYEALIDTCLKALMVPPEEGVLFVGHGGLNVGNAAYSVLQMKLWRRGWCNARVITLESYPTLEDTVLPWEWVDGKRPSKIHVYPLLLVAGDHMLNDMFGDEADSIASRLYAAGYEVVEHRHGLGEYPAIGDLYVQHLEDCLANRYEERSKRRPVIPDVK